MRTPIVTLAIAAGLTISHHASAAEMSVVMQHRTVLGDSNIFAPPQSQQDIDEIAAPDAGAFDEVLTTAVSTPTGVSTTTATQQSTIDACQFDAVGGFTATVQIAPPTTAGYTVGGSVYHVTFSLNEAATCRIVGALASQNGSHSRVSLGQGAVSLVNILAADESLAVAQQRSLAPGQYTFTVQAFGTAALQSRGNDLEAASFDMRLSICFDPADLNIDGEVNVTDLLMLINAWGSCQAPVDGCLADLDDDASVGVNDLLILINTWG